MKKRSTFRVRGMDCPSEEQMVRMKLEPLEKVLRLEFELGVRTLRVYHTGDVTPIARALADLNLGEWLEETVEGEFSAASDNRRQRSLLWWVLGINFAFFLIEMTTGWISGSMGLIADSLDMLADSIVYGLSLLAVGAAVSRKKQVAKLSGYLQMTLAALGFFEVVRRFVSESDPPIFEWMIVVSAFALAGNIVSLWIINKVKSGEAHIQASAIFTSNDIIVNGGVIVAGVLVYLLQSKVPDLVVGGIVFTLVMRGAFRILSLAR